MPRSREKESKPLKSTEKGKDDGIDQQSDSDVADAFKEDVLHEIKKLGRSIREGCKRNMKEIGASLRDDVRHDVERILETVERIRDSQPSVGEAGLRAAASSTLMPKPQVLQSWDYPHCPTAMLPLMVCDQTIRSTGCDERIKISDAQEQVANKSSFFQKELIDRTASTLPTLTPEVNGSMDGRDGGTVHVTPRGSIHINQEDVMRACMEFSQQPEDEDGLDEPVAPLPCSVVDASDNGTTALIEARKSLQVPGADVSPTREEPGKYGTARFSETARFAESRKSRNGFQSDLRTQRSTSQGKGVSPLRRGLNMQREQAKAESDWKQSKPWRLLTLAEFIQTPTFDNLVGGVILLNAAVIGVQTDYNVKNLSHDVPLPFFLFEIFFMMWFTFELSLRLYVFRCGFFSFNADGMLWNYFDTMVVSAQLVEVFFELVARSADVDASNLRVLRVLRILRLVRILRVVRVLHLISELRAIVSSIAGSFRSLVWVVVLLFLMMYIVAVFFTQSITDHLLDSQLADSNFEMSDDEDVLYYYFGSLGRAILSLWQAMSGGLDWDSLAGPFFTKISWLTGMAFASYIAFALLALMNVVTGVFVQTALLSAQKEEQNFVTSQIISLFSKSDSDGDARLSWDEVLDSLQDPISQKEWISIGIQEADARYLFKLLDLETSGEVAFEEFMAGCLRLNGSAKALDLLTVMQEARRNDEKLQTKLNGISETFIDVHETVRNTQDDLTKLVEDFSLLVQSLSAMSSSQEISSLSRKVDVEFGAMKVVLSTAMPRVPPAPPLPPLPPCPAPRLAPGVSRSSPSSPGCTPPSSPTAHCS